MSLKVGIVGAAGYAGAELIRLVLGHPEFELVAITSNADAGQPLSAVYPSFAGVSDLVFTTHDAPELKSCDAVFLAVPHTAAMVQVPALLASGVSCIDLSADYRLNDASVLRLGMPPSIRAPSCSRPVPSVCPSCSAKTWRPPHPTMPTANPCWSLAPVAIPPQRALPPRPPCARAGWPRTAP